MQDFDPNDPNLRRIYCLTVDRLIEQAGNGHSYQVRSLFLLSCQWLLGAFFLMGFPILLLDPSFQCTDEMGRVFQCSEEEYCALPADSRTLMHPGVSSTIVYDFHLVCDQKAWKTWTNVALFLGGAGGAFYFAERQELKGRLHVLVKSVSLSAIFLLVCSFSWSVWIFAIGAFFVHFGCRGHMGASLTFFSEISSENLRNLAPNIFHAFWAIGQILVAGFLYVIPSWRAVFFYLTCIPLFITTFIFRFMRESPRYLVAKKNFRDAREAIVHMWRLNRPGQQVLDFEFEEKKQLEEMQDRVGRLLNIQYGQGQGIGDEIQESASKHSMLSLFRYKSLKNKSVCILIVFLAVNFNYFGTTFGVESLSGDMYFNLFIFGVVELLGYLTSAFLCLNYPRRQSLKWLLWVGGFSYCMFAFLHIEDVRTASNTIKNLNLLMASAGKFAMSGCISMFFVFMPEIYPTSVRHFALGFFATTSRLILVFIPPYLNYFKGEKVSAMIPYGIISFICVYFVMKLPETFGKDIKEQLDEEGEEILLPGVLA